MRCHQISSLAVCVELTEFLDNIFKTKCVLTQTHCSYIGVSTLSGQFPIRRKYTEGSVPIYAYWHRVSRLLFHRFLPAWRAQQTGPGGSQHFHNEMSIIISFPGFVETSFINHTFLDEVEDLSKLKIFCQLFWSKRRNLWCYYNLIHWQDFHHCNFFQDLYFVRKLKDPILPSKSCYYWFNW